MQYYMVSHDVAHYGIAWLGKALHSMGQYCAVKGQ